MKKLAIGVLIAIGSWGMPAGAETTNCTQIAAVPTTLTTSGIYCLKSNLTTGRARGFAIRVRANNVVIDLNGFTLRNVRGAATTAAGIFARDKSNIVVRNGTIIGFYRGIYLDNNSGQSANHLVEKIRGIGNGFAAIQVEGENLVVRNNQVSQTGPNDDTITANGIYVGDFKNARVSGNTVSDTQESQTARGIFAISGSEIVIENNMVSDTNSATATYAVHVQSTNRAHIRNNQLLNQVSATTGIRAVSSSGVTCTGNFIDAFNNTHSTCNNISGTLP